MVELVLQWTGVEMYVAVSKILLTSFTGYADEQTVKVYKII